MTTTTTAGSAPATDGAGPLPDTVVEVRDLVKRYGATPVLHGVSFEVRRGELFGLLGTNGAGKTTTVEILQGLRTADGGSVKRSSCSRPCTRPRARPTS